MFDRFSHVRVTRNFNRIIIVNSQSCGSATNSVGGPNSLAIPNGWEGQIRSRSSLGAKGMIMPNGVGTIDSDYRGEIKIILINHGKETFTVEPQTRIAQLVLAKTCSAKFDVCSSLNTSQRGEEGFGDSGCHPIL